MKENLGKYIDKVFKEVNECEDPVKYVHGLVGLLGGIHPSDAYVVINDVIVPKKNDRIMKCKVQDIGEYQAFQDLYQKAKASVDHDKTLATNLDVDRAVSKAYGIAISMIKTVMDTNNAKFNKMASAINKIEERLGIDVTNFEEGDENDSTGNENEQRFTETTGGSGDTSKAE